MTYFAVDMHSAGVEVRPLRQITGEAEFNEVYLTDARIPDANRIGAEGEGWRVSLTTLMNERTAIGGGGGGAQAGSGAIGDAGQRVERGCPTTSRPAAQQRSADAAVGAGPRCCASPTCAPAANRRPATPAPRAPWPSWRWPS